MIVLINGPFGVGKTTVARALVSRLRRAVIFDPEHVGWWLRLAGSGAGPAQSWPTAAEGCAGEATQQYGSEHADFQDDPRWPGHVVRTARVMRVFGRTLVVPITLWRAERYESIVRGLREFSPTHTFRLSAGEAELRRRIEQDVKQPSARAWRLRHLRSCLDALSTGDFGLEVPTDDLTPEEVARTLEQKVD